MVLSPTSPLSAYPQASTNLLVSPFLLHALNQFVSFFVESNLLNIYHPLTSSFMDDSNLGRDRFNDQLGVNRMGRGIRKTPLNQPTFSGSSARPQQPQPRVYNISKNDFRCVVQQLTGSPSRDPSPPPPLPPVQLGGSRLQRIRPPPISPAVLPPPPPARPALSPHMHSLWANTGESPVSAYMGTLQNLIMDPGLGAAQPTPWGNHPPPSPTWSFLELLSPTPRSPYRPGYQYQLPPLTPSFFFSPTTTASSPGPFGPGPRPPPSPGGLPPPSPGFFPILSPRWRN